MRNQFHEITERMHTILGAYMKDKEADKIMLALHDLDNDDFVEFVKLIREWATLDV